MQNENPVVRGFCPDPSICRVGRDYYLCVSSYEYFPGIPIYHSRDLVNWEQIGNCVQRAEEFPALKTTKDSGGVWAPTLRYENGTFYVTATFDQCGTFLVSAKDPAGEWSSPVWIEDRGIDPSLYFENGRAYYCIPGEKGIEVEEMEIETGKLLGDRKPLWKGIGAGFLEGPHLYKIGEWYYILAAEGGTQFNHMATMARSRNLTGPYESCPHNPGITNVHDCARQVQCTGHADLFEDHNGNWWMVHLGIRTARRTMSHLGRETFLTPRRWEDGWPVTDSDRMARLVEEGPLWESQKLSRQFLPDFNQTEWEPGWVFLRSPLWENYRRGNGCLCLYPSRTTFSAAKNAVFAAFRQPDFSCSLQTEFTFTAEQNGDEAGLAVLLDHQFYYRFCVRKGADQTEIVLDKTADDMREIIPVCSLPAQTPDALCSIKLILRADKERYSFSCKVGEQPESSPVTASTRFLAAEVAGRTFTGTVMGVYTSCREETGSVMRVKRFEVESKTL